MKVKKNRGRHIILPEITRWLVNPVFLAAVFFAGVFIVFDILASVPEGILLREGELNGAVHYIVSTAGTVLFKYTGLCLCAYLGSGLYAEDFEENAVYMRIQRLGCTRYALGRVIHVMLSAWLCAALAELLGAVILMVGFGQPFLALDPSFSDTGEGLFAQGKYVSYCFILFGICGFRAAFYALLAMAFSVFVPNRKAAAALPVLLWYFNQFMLCRFEWIPGWLQPRTLFTEENAASFLFGISEWSAFFLAAAYTLVTGALVFLLLRYALRRNRTFGGKME